MLKSSFGKYLLTLSIFLAVDLVWLLLLAPGFYQFHLGFLLSENPNWVAAALFYLLHALGLFVFVIKPGGQQQMKISFVGLGGLFGLVTYATFDLTNQALIRDWPWIVTVVDLIWGVVLGALTTFLTLTVLHQKR